VELLFCELEWSKMICLDNICWSGADFGELENCQTDP